MDSNELNFYMMRDPLIKRRFIGVYPIDMIPEYFISPSILIINLDKSNEKGSHWIVIHQKDDKQIEIFDSLGKTPKKDIRNLLMSNNKGYMYSHKRVQDYFTETCGQFCLFYSFYSCRGLTLQDIVNKFNSNLKSNELIVQRFFIENFIM